MYTHICVIYKVTAVNHVTVETVHIFDIYHCTNMVVIYVPLHFYCSEPIDPTSVHIQLKHLFSDTVTNYGHKCEKKTNMPTKCALITAMTNK